LLHRYSSFVSSLTLPLHPIRDLTRLIPRLFLEVIVASENEYFQVSRNLELFCNL
jgi:hypothetical protein